MLTRRELLIRAAALAGLTGCAPLPAAARASRYRIGTCDWSLGLRTDPAAFALAKRVGVTGLQVDLVDDPSAFLAPERFDLYRRAAAENDVSIASLALGVLNRVPLKSEARTEQWLRDAVEVARAFECRVILLAFFNKGDLRDDPAGRAEVIRRLRLVAPAAERAGVVLGIESWLSAAENLAIVDAVGSSSVQVYYDVGNSNRMGYDVYEEIAFLGAERICEVHAKENGALLGDGKLDYHRLRGSLDEVGYRGWVIIEGSLPEGAELLPSYQRNAAFLNDIFA